MQLCRARRAAPPDAKKPSGRPAMFFDARPARRARRLRRRPPTLCPTAPSAARRRRLPRADIVDGDAMAGNRPAGVDGAAGPRRGHRPRAWRSTPVETGAPRSAGGVGGRAGPGRGHRPRAWRSRWRPRLRGACHARSHPGGYPAVAAPTGPSRRRPPPRRAAGRRHGFPRSHGPPERKVKGPTLTLRCCPHRAMIPGNTLRSVPARAKRRRSKIQRNPRAAGTL
jgi:hypothetical protein